jgi:hypothetical protein
MTRVRIQVDQSGVHARWEKGPRRRQAGQVYAVPVLVQSDSMLVLTLEVVAQTGRMGIRITSKQGLKGGPTATWTLEHLAWQGPRPSGPTWGAIPVTLPVDYLLTDALPAATHAFRLVKVEAGQTSRFPEAVVLTPDDAVWNSIQGMLANDVVSVAEKTTLLLAYAQLLGEQLTVGGAADEWDVPRLAYDAAISALKARVAALAPPFEDRSQDTPLGDGGGAALWALWVDVMTKRDQVLLQVEQARKQSLEQMLGDSRLPPGERRRVKAERDRIQFALAELAALAALGVPSAEAAAALTAFQVSAAALEAHLDALPAWDASSHDWDSYEGIVDLGTGGGPSLYAKIKGATEAEAAARRLLNTDTRGLTVSLGSDGVISAGADKQRWRLEWGRVQGEYASVRAQAVSLGVYVAYLEAAFNALSSYINNLVPPLSDGTKDTPVVPSSWEARWNDYYARVAEVQTNNASVLKARADQANTLAAQARALVSDQLTSLPATPGTTYAGKLVWLVQDSGGRKAGWYRGSSDGLRWELPSIIAEQIFGQVIAHIVAAHAVGAEQLDVDLALVSILKAGFTADADGDAIQGLKISGLPGDVPLRIGPLGTKIGKMQLSEPIVRSLALMDSTNSSSTSWHGILKGNNNPAVRMGAPNPGCLSLAIDLAVEGTLYDLWLFTLTLQPTSYDDNLDMMCGGFIRVESGGATQASVPFTIGSRSYGNVIHSDSVNSSGVVVPVRVLSSCRSNGRLIADIGVQLRNTYFFSNAFFTSGPSGVQSAGTSSSSGTAYLGGGTVGGGRSARDVLLLSE